MYQRILAPLDGSAFSEQALPYALAVADRMSAVLHLAIAHEPLPIDTLAQDGSFLDTQLRRWQAEYLDEVSGRIEEGGGPAPVRDVLEGGAAQALEAYTAEKGIDLIVIATHGRGGLTRAWLGSVADRLIRHVNVPILLVRPREDATASAPVAREVLFRRILIPLDGSPLGEAILEPATGLGDLDDGTYELVRVVGSPFLVGPSARAAAGPAAQGPDDQRRAQAEDYLARIADRLQQDRARRVRVSAPVADSIAGTILDRAEASGADLIAMSTHGHGQLTRTVLGSHADKVLRAANVPVLIKHPAEA